MLNPVYRLASDAQKRLQLSPTSRRAFGTTVVVPREVSIFEHLPGSGVALHERSGFARLQALRLSPFANTGGSAAMRNKILMLWLWDDREIDEAIAAGGLDPARVTKIAEPLMLPLPTTSGTAALRCAGGVDHLQLAGGAITASRWQPDTALRDLPPELAARPWARDLLRSGSLIGNWSEASFKRTFAFSAWTLAIGCAAYLAYWEATTRGLEARRAAVAAQTSTTDLLLGRMTELKQAYQRDQAWLDDFNRLSSGIRIDPLLDALQRVVEANRLVVKELDLRNDDLRITVVSVGGVLDLPAVLRSIAGVPGFASVQLRQSENTQQASFSVQVTGFRTVSTMPSVMERP
ncbi:hypothetical protein [Piscinibacter sakaiensis]|uniref:hypothetical protein n=1 Tax=Piscinibacter sakaiensis TaxID=1547922 RepID=UPI003AAB037C